VAADGDLDGGGYNRVSKEEVEGSEVVREEVGFYFLFLPPTSFSFSFTGRWRTQRMLY
jgi:hypothetical protein